MAQGTLPKDRRGEGGQESIGELILRQRLAEQLTQTELADGICARAYISQIEQGSRFPGPDMLARISDKLNVPLQFFARAYVSSSMASSDQCLELVEELAKRRDPAEARAVLDHVIRISRRWEKPADETPRFKFTLAIIHLYEADYEKCDALLDESLAARLRSGRITAGLIEVYAAKATCAAKQRDVERATDLFQQAFNAAFAINPEPGRKPSPKMLSLQYEIVEWLLRMFLLQRQFHTARTIFNWAVSTWKGSGVDGDMPYRLVVMGALTDLGAGNHDAAIATLKDHLDAGTSAGGPRHLAAVHNNLAVAYRLKEDWDKVHYHASIALDLWRRLRPAPPGSHGSANELAYAALAQGDYEGMRRALDFARAPYDVGYNVPDAVLPAESLLLEARLALARRDIDSARDYLDQAEMYGAGIRWLKTMVHVERVQAAIQAGEPMHKVEEALAGLRSSVAKWAI